MIVFVRHAASFLVSVESFVLLLWVFAFIDYLKALYLYCCIVVYDLINL